MCIKPYKGSSSGLRPTAEEWRPTHQLLLPQQHTTITFTVPIRVLSPVCFSPYGSYIHQGYVQLYHNSPLMPATHFNGDHHEKKIDEEMNDNHEEDEKSSKKQLGGRRRLLKEWKPKNKSTNTNNKKSLTVSVTTQDVSLPKTINTTVMIKNIPNQIRSDYMLKFLDQCSKDHSLQYDFLYLPMDFIKKYNLGYAFVNFTSATAALRFKNIFQNFKWGTIHTDKCSFTSKKVCEITWARIQGKENLIKRFQQSIFRCEKKDFLPLLLDPPRNGLDENPSPPIALGTLHRRG